MNINSYVGLALSILLVACGGGGGGGGGGETPAPSTPPPTISFSANPTSVLVGSESTLTWSSSNASSCAASGAWSGSRPTSGSENVTITTVGDSSFTITCSGEGGSSSSIVTIEGFRQTDGVVVDGYITGADVFIDENANFIADATENSTTSDNEGKFTIKYADGNLVSLGGTDLDSQTLLDNLLITHKLAGHSEFKAITPVTSVAAFMQDASSINSTLGIDASIDIFTFDPVANKGDGGIYDYLYEKGNQLTVLAFALQNITNNINASTDTTQDYFKAISEEIEKEYNETLTKVDIETEAFVIKALENVIEAKSVTIDEAARANVSRALSGMLPIVQVKSTDNLTTSIIRFALSTLQTDIQAIANGSASAEIVTSYTEDLLNYIAQDQNIDSDEIAPDINAIADSAITSEDVEVQINVLLNDSFVTSAPFSLSAIDGLNGSTSISNDLLLYSPDADFNGTDSFSYTLSQGDKTSSADVTVTIQPVNDEPSIDIASTIQVEENQTDVTTVSVSDVDNDELTLSLGGPDADSFNLSDENVLTFKEAPDYETKNSYSISLSLTDGIETVIRDVTIAIIDINDAAPVFTSDATFSAAENQTAIGTVTATDPEGDSFSFTISGSELQITPGGVLTFISEPDYETKATYNATVTVVDTEDNSATQDITVNVTNLNDNTPSINSSASFSAEENQTAIGTVTATDADGDAVTFTVSGSELTITSAGVLTFASAPDYEAKSTYTATVTASDGANSTTQDITVNVTNVNDVAPEIITSASFSAAENQSAIGTLLAKDIEGDSLTFTISGSDITIIGSTAAEENGNWPALMEFVTAPDYETEATYTATVTVSDGTNSTTQDITVNITNVNDNNPVITSANEYSIEENTTEVGQATATDADGDGVAFSITSDSNISIDSSSGVIYFDIAPDYETATSHSATITVSDGAFITSQDITISVTDADEGPPELIGLEIMGLSGNTDTDFNNSLTQIQFTVTDETAISKIVLKLQNTDTQSLFENTENYTLADGDNSEGMINDNLIIAFTNKLRSGTYEITELSLYDTLDKSVNAILDTNFDTSFAVSNSNQEIVPPELLAHTLTVNDNVLTVHALIKEEDSAIAKYRHRGIDTEASTEEINEAGYYINVHASDTSASYVDDIVDSSDLTDNGDGTFNVITRHNMSSNADAEAAEIILYDIHDTAFNRTEYLQASSVKPIPDENADPIFISDSTFSVEENETAIGTVSARNAKGDVLTYSVSGNEIIINETSGVMVFANAPDYETKSSYTATVTATDGTNSSSQEIVINITDVREQTIQVSVAANNNGSGNVYVINGNQRPNLDLVKGVTYTFIHPTAHPFRFSTTANGTHGGGTEYTTGVDTTASGITVIKVTDNTPENLYYYCSIHSGMGNGINLIENAPPEFTSSATFSANENQTSIGSVTTTDAEGDAITYSISGSEIEISAVGVLSFVAAPDYETKSSYTATVSANDGTSTSTQEITVNINNLNDNNPSFTSLASFSAAENQTAIGTVTATDADGDAVTFTVSGSELTITSAGVLTFATTPDYETKSTYTATVTASDGTNSTTQDITVNVTNVNDVAPIFSSESSFTVEENQTAIGTVTATDAEGDAVTFTVSGSELTITSAGVLTFATAPDYETKSTYTATVTASDGINSTTQDITVNVTNVNDNSPSISSSTFSADENQTAIGTVTAADADGDTISFGISGSDITIDSSSGVIAFRSAPNYESINSYSVIVSASDGTNTSTQEITININDVNDAPVTTSKAYWDRLLPQSQTTTTWSLEGVSDEDGDTLTYSIVSNGTYGTASVNSSSGVVSYVTAASTQSTVTDTFTYKVNDGTSDSNTASITLEYRTDPLYKYQWHLDNTGQTNFASNSGTADQDLNVDADIVAGIDGDGVVIAVLDVDLEIAHPDLADNILAGYSYDYVDGDNDPTSTVARHAHGTSVAGIMAAVGWNNKGGRGIAPNAELVGYNVLRNYTESVASSGMYDGLQVSADVDIFNMSYGPVTDYAVDKNHIRERLSALEEAALLNGITNLRGGKGAIYISAAGNDWRVRSDYDGDGTEEWSWCSENGVGSISFYSDLMPCWDSVFDEMTDTPYVIGVGALDANGLRASYSTPGANIWVSSFGGEYGNDTSFSGMDNPAAFGDDGPAIMTTDTSSCSYGAVRTGVSSSNAFNAGSHAENTNCNYTSEFNGTSSAAPNVAGVVALMLEANPDLTWRDVKHILASNSVKIDSARSKSVLGITQYSWVTNAANYEHHNWYGFGKVDAAAAIDAAQAYTSGSLGSFVETDWAQSGTINGTLASFSSSSTSLNVSAPSGSSGKVEFVRINIALTHDEVYDLGLRLTSPDGTTANIMTPFTIIEANPNGTSFDIGVNAFYGENISGTWTLRIDEYTDDSVDGILNNWAIKVYGH